jgi:hypothetical protein
MTYFPPATPGAVTGGATASAGVASSVSLSDHVHSTSNIAVLNAAAAFSSTVGGTVFSASGLTGATAASRYVGATASGAPVSGTFLLGDFVIDQTGKVYVCTTAGTPGTWTQVGGGSPSKTLIASLATGVTPSAGLTFSNIPQTYTHLSLDCDLSSAGTGSSSNNMYLRINGYTSNYYASATNVSPQSQSFIGYIPEQGGGRSRFGHVSVEFPNYCKTDVYGSGTGRTWWSFSPPLAYFSSYTITGWLSSTIYGHEYMNNGAAITSIFIFGAQNIYGTARLYAW